MGTRLGIVLPSSNTIVEPLAARVLAETGICAHFSRVGVIEISLDPASMRQFEHENQLAAAQLLADAQVNCIVWGGTSASWLGPAHDASVCAAIEERFGLPSDSSLLAMNRKLGELGAKSIGLVTPYTGDVQAQIIDTYRGLGYVCVAETHYGGTLSEEFASIAPDTVTAMVAAVAEHNPDAILVMCTNMQGAMVAEAAVDRIGIPVLDSALETVAAARNLVNC